MKYLFFSTIIILICACSSNNKKEVQGIVPHTSGFILFVYMGETNHPVSPVLIRTDSTSSYLKYVGESQELLEKNGFLIPKIYEENYMKKITVEPLSYFIIKNYIIKNNTNTDRYFWNSDNNTVKVILEDDSDTIKYVVNKSNERYFQNLIDSVKRIDTKALIDGLTYLRNIQEGQ